MALTLCSDLSPASWLVTSDLPWERLVTFGPAGFEAYARLRFLPDPAYADQRENDVDIDDNPSDAERLRTLLHLLAAHTTTPRDCSFCLWDGYGELYGGSPATHTTMIAVKEPAADAQPAAVPASALPAPVVAAPKVVVPHRAYHLFHGPLADVGDWGAASPWHGTPDMPEPAFVWPADHAWCVAKDVDPHWAGIGADRTVVDRLVADPRLDVVAADPDAAQPHYR